LHYAPPFVSKYLIDPHATASPGIRNLTTIAEKAGKGVPELVKKLMNNG